MKKIILVLSVLTVSTFFVANKKVEPQTVTASKQTDTKEFKITWLDMQTAIKLSEKEPRKMLIDIYTDWCGWCKKMDASTFQDPRVIEYVNRNFYAVKFNAERKDTLYLREKGYHFNAGYRANQLAAEFMQGKMGYPTIVFLDERMNRAEPIQGYQTVEQIMPIMKYFSTNAYLTQKYEEWQAKQK